MSVDEILNTATQARIYRDSLPIGAPARRHLSALLDALASTRSARREAEYAYARKLALLEHKIDQLQEPGYGRELALLYGEVPPQPTSTLACWDANGSEVHP